MAALRVARSCLLCASRATARRPITSFTSALSRPYSTPGATPPSKDAQKAPFKRQGSYRIPQDAATVQIPDPRTPDNPILVSWMSKKNDQLLWLRDPSPQLITAAEIRDSCTCSKCRDPASGQKKYSSIEIDPRTKITHVRPVEDGLLVEFDRGIARLNETSHETVISRRNLLALAGRAPEPGTCPPTSADIAKRMSLDFWDAQTLPNKLQHVDYAAFTQGGDEFWRAMSDLVRLGVVFLKNVPQDSNSVVTITEAIGNIQETFYGRTFDVKAKPNAENVAYTSEYLGLHQDLLYLSSVPQIQLLHCMENSCAGGESLFTDGARVAKLLGPYAEPGQPLYPLANVKVPYGYHKYGHNYQMSRTVFPHNIHKSTPSLYWSPPFQDSRVAARADVRSWIRAARILESLLNDEEAVFTHRLQPGECVIFDNRRVLHGRRAFDAAGGSRWLRGAYIATDAFNSKASQIPTQFAEERRDKETLLADMFPDRHASWQDKARRLVTDMRQQEWPDTRRDPRPSTKKAAAGKNQPRLRREHNSNHNTKNVAHSSLFKELVEQAMAESSEGPAANKDNKTGDEVSQQGPRP